MEPNEALIAQMNKLHEAKASEQTGPAVAIANVIRDEIEDVIENVDISEKDENDDEEKESSAFSLRSGNSPLYKNLGSSSIK